MIRRILRKGPRVVAYRAWQKVRLVAFHRLGYWHRLQSRMPYYWRSKRIQHWLSLAQNNALPIGPAHLEAFRAWSAEEPAWTQALRTWADDVWAGRIEIFDQAYQFDRAKMPWHTDWRWSYTWEPAYFESFSFYIANKTVPYDVKFPWELSRFAFLLPLAEMSVLTGEVRWRDRIVRTVVDWEQANPVGYSVNWYPMEVSMRGINLALLALMLAADTATLPEHVAPLLRQLTLHGEFLFRKIEYTDVRGNHYAANLVALLLMGAVLRSVYRPAARWWQHAAARIDHEITRQYCADGVNFEKSTAYHRLVTELFLTAAIELERAGQPLSVRARTLLHEACVYTWYYMRPDGSAPNWGDNDNGRVLGFDASPVRDHRSLLAVAAAFFDDAALKSAAPQGSAALPWLLARAGVQRWNALAVNNLQSAQSRLFAASGMAISRSGEHYLFMDYGEVGQNGRGGHGHNDTFSFELCLDGEAVIVDSGSPIYTGDLQTYDRFRSTKAHNTLSVDGQEMARLRGPWRISDEATPRHVTWDLGEPLDQIAGEHTGFTRLDDPVIHHRTFSFDKQAGRLVIHDRLRCAGAHQVEHFFHLAPTVEPSLQADALCVRLATGKRVLMRWPVDAQARLEPDQVSDNYGQVVPSSTLVLTHQITGDTKLSFEIELERPPR